MKRLTSIFSFCWMIMMHVNCTNDKENDQASNKGQDSLKAGEISFIGDAGIIDENEILPHLLPDSIYTGNTRPEELINFARKWTHVPYKYASAKPAEGFDCSGFITYIFNHFNIAVPRSSVGFTNVGRIVELQHAKPGDLILFTGTDSSIRVVGHMGLVVSNKNGLLEFIHASSGKANGVVITPLEKYYMGRFEKVIRIFPE